MCAPVPSPVRNYHACPQRVVAFLFILMQGTGSLGIQDSTQVQLQGASGLNEPRAVAWDRAPHCCARPPAAEKKLSVKFALLLSNK
jgi:hypothetical protein